MAEAIARQRRLWNAIIVPCARMFELPGYTDHDRDKRSPQIRCGNSGRGSRGTHVRHRSRQARRAAWRFWSAPIARARRYSSPAEAAAILRISIANRKISIPQIRTSQNRRWPATRLRTLSRWWRSMAFRITRKRSASFFATAPRRTLWRCSKPNAGTRASQIILNSKIRGGSPRRRICRRNGRRRISCASPGGGNGRTFDPKDWERLRFGYDIARQFGLKIRDTRPALVPLVLERSGSHALLRSGRRLRGSRRFHGPAIIPRKNVDHASRLERTSDPADFLVLARANPIRIDLAPGRDVTPRFEKPKIETWPRRGPPFRPFCPNGLPPAGWICTRRMPGQIRRSKSWNTKCTNGLSSPRARKAMKKPKLPRAAWTPTNYRARPWKAGACRDSIFYRRSGRCHRTSRRIQFPMGLGLRRRGGPRAVK